MTTSMLACMFYAIYTNEMGKYEFKVDQTWPLFTAKFLSAVVLHFMLYPEVSDAMTIMKFAVYSFEDFVNPLRRSETDAEKELHTCYKCWPVSWIVED